MVASAVAVALTIVAALVTLGGVGVDRYPGGAPGDPAPTPTPPRPGASNGGKRGEGPPDKVKLFRMEMRRRCIHAGRVPAISATADDDIREDEMRDEARALERLSDGLKGARALAPTRRLRDLMDNYLRRLKAQIVLDRRIADAAHAHDDYSVAVGMGQNARNRQKRNEVVDEAPLPKCLRAREPV